jgi:ATP-dependent DNA helicase DinG
MADAVAGTLQHGGVLLVKAGTGTGKTLAYLVPAILSGQRVLISTGTKNLQEQIYFKDLAVLREALGRPFTATYMKGRGNYLCLHRFESFRESASSGTARLFGESAAQIFLPILEDWSAKTETGDRAEIGDLPEDLPFWGEIAATSENCIGTECPRYTECFITRMRSRAAESNLVVVNHHLLCADASGVRAPTARSSLNVTMRSSTRRISSRTCHAVIRRLGEQRPFRRARTRR